MSTSCDESRMGQRVSFPRRRSHGGGHTHHIVYANSSPRCPARPLSSGTHVPIGARADAAGVSREASLGMGGDTGTVVGQTKTSTFEQFQSSFFVECTQHTGGSVSYECKRTCSEFCVQETTRKLISWYSVLCAAWTASGWKVPTHQMFQVGWE